MSKQPPNFVVGDAQVLEVESVYSVNVSIRGVDYVLLVARHTASNGIRCLTGHDILRSAEPDFNFYPAISAALKKCDQLTEI